MSYNRKQFDKQKLRKLAEITSHHYGRGAYYDRRKGRFIRIYKSNGRNSRYAKYKRLARKKSRSYDKKYGFYSKNAEDLIWDMW